MKKNPFLKLEENVIRKLYGNTATLTYNVSSRVYNSSSGVITTSGATFSRTVNISDPTEFADALVDGENIKRGDLRCDVARKTLVDALRPLEGDSGGTLSSYRSATVTAAGIDTTTDRITFGGKEYSIRKITGREVYANEPAVYRLQLREVK